MGFHIPFKFNIFQNWKKMNGISINLNGYDDGEIFPLCISKFEHAVEIDMLLLKDETKSHYVWIKNLSRFLSHLIKHDGVTHYCRYCLHSFCRADLLSEYTVLCKKHYAHRTKCQMPKMMLFSNYQFQLKAPFIIYADFECFLPKI